MRVCAWKFFILRLQIYINVTKKIVSCIIVIFRPYNVKKLYVTLKWSLRKCKLLQVASVKNCNFRKKILSEVQNAFFDIRLTNANARSQKHLPISIILKNQKKHEKEKRAYNRIMNVEHGIFIPLVFSLTGCESHETSMFHKHIAQKIANKTEENYEKVQTLIRCKLSFLVLRSVLLCIRGSLSISKDSVVLDDVSLTCSAAGLFWFVHRN